MNGKGSRDPDSRPAGQALAGLCPTCKYVKKVVSERGSTFLRCKLATGENGFRKYPPQPVRVCPGYEE